MIEAPARVICEDNEAVRRKFEVQLFRLLGGDKAPGGMNADLPVPLVAPFLDTPLPEAG